MNIKDHIEAGHYPRDEKGRALVPMLHGGTFTVTATDKPQTTYGGENGQKRRFIVGWDSKGIVDTHTEDSRHLLPPPPRKVKVTAKFKVANPLCPDDWRVISLHGAGQLPIGATIELTGEYEEPWA